ncbi:MAG: hypothetical protein ACK4N5_14880, partial [Myxococcales bacterium]
MFTSHSRRLPAPNAGKAAHRKFLASAMVLSLLACGEKTHESNTGSDDVGTAQQPLVCGGSGSGSTGGIADAQKGAYVVLMGGTQTVGNALKPYGMVYDLVKNLQIPVLWAYRTNKTSNTQVDFTVDGIDIVGGTFVIPSSYANLPAVKTALARWQAAGVVLYGPTKAAFTPPTYFQRITGFPNIVLDPQNGYIAQGYLTAAGLPTFPVRYPSNLDSCNDMFVMPHADPTWANHGNLLAFVQSGGFLWSGCHAPSVLEALDGPTPDGAPDMNFLTSTGLIHYKSHSQASPPYTAALFGDPLMQFVGLLDGALQNGSEQVYLPLLAGAWRQSTKIVLSAPTQVDFVAGRSPGPAAKIAYGRAFGDPAAGVVMSPGSH